jgi:hypothetical protein
MISGQALKNRKIASLTLFRFLAQRTLIVLNGCLSDLLDFTYDSARSLNQEC